MESKTKAMLAAGGQLAGMGYLISGYANAGVFLLVVTAAALALFQAENHRRWPWRAAVLTWLAGGLILGMQPMANEWGWQAGVMLNGVIAMLGLRWVVSLKREERQEIRWHLDWLIALALLFCGLLFLMPSWLRVYVMEPWYTDGSAGLNWLPLLVFMPCFTIRLRLLQNRAMRKEHVWIFEAK